MLAYTRLLSALAAGNIKLIAIIGMVMAPGASIAHNSAGELANMSLEDLLAIPIAKNTELSDSGRWQFSVRTIFREQSGYLDGDSKISNAKVQWNPSKTRTATNFPIIVDRIQQEATLLSLSYQLTDLYRIAVSTAHIVQSTDHFSAVPGYEAFAIKSSGMGDTTVNLNRLLWRHNQRSLYANIGVSLPTGSIDKKGDTPRGPGSQILPYSMQLGSGTYDFPFGLNYQSIGPEFAYGGNFAVRMRTNENDRDYRLGDEYSADVWLELLRDKRFSPTLRLSYVNKENITGSDQALLMNNGSSFIYPVSMANPNFYARQNYNIHIGGRFKLGANSEKNPLTIQFGYAIPIYEAVDGVQPRSRNTFSLGITKSL